jgi:LacI family transcriptional regulator
MSKYLEMSRRIEAEIDAGRWEQGKMPSVRALAEQYDVSVVTAARALQLLRDKGLISTVERSGCYLVPQNGAAGERWSLCLNVTPGPWQQSTAAVLRCGFDALARKHGLVVDTECFPSRDGQSERELTRQVRSAIEGGIRGVFLLPSRLNDAMCQQEERFLAACRSAGLAVVLLERNLRGRDRPLEWDLVCTDDVGAGSACTRHLLEQGRHRIAFVTGSPTSSHQGRAAGYLLTLYQQAPEQTPLLLEQNAILNVRDAYRELAETLLAQRADGVVCYQDYVALGLIMEFMARGVRVPADIAVVGFDDLPIGKSFAVGVSTYAFPAEAVARHALRVMRTRIENPTEPPVRVDVPGQLIIRESSCAAACRASQPN